MEECSGFDWPCLLLLRLPLTMMVPLIDSTTEGSSLLNHTQLEEPLE